MCILFFLVLISIEFLMFLKMGYLNLYVYFLVKEVKKIILIWKVVFLYYNNEYFIGLV